MIAVHDYNGLGDCVRPPWSRWYAWHPVRVQTPRGPEWVWLECVERARCCPPYASVEGGVGGHWVHRELLEKLP